MKRRQFIGLAAVGTAAWACPTTARPDAIASPTTLAHPHLLDVLRNRHLVRNLGRRYREEVPAENSPRALERAILAEMRVTKSELGRVQVNEQVQRDFADGRTVMLDGWVLSVTEARQCALFSLLPA